MTIEERFDRIEHLTAGIAEERRKDREEYKTLWRDGQRQINELGIGLNALRNKVEDLAVETRLRFEQVADRFDQVGQRIDQVGGRIDQVGERVDKLVSAIGQLIAKPSN
jgi:methyl-accepting chemotaxis protein